MDPVKTDCRHFRSDRPCEPHKHTGVVCATCTDDYDPVEHRVLVLKLAAVGDVLRTTGLLPAIHRRWPRAHVTWVTSPAAAALFAGNPLVDRVVTYTGSVPLELATERFDAVLNPDASAETCALAHAARAEEHLGFGFDEQTATAGPRGAGAETWFAMGLSDELKKANRRTYQDLVADVLGLDYRREPPVLELTDAERAKGLELRAAHPPAEGRRVVGLNTGAGTRWRFKRWTESGMTALVQRLSEQGHRVFLLGGPDEVERNARLQDATGDAAVHTGCDNDLRTFAGLVDACDVLVTGDTLAMHMGVARSKPVVALFGPTSSHEIELFDRGERLVSDVPCLCCYLPDCDVAPNCMESLSVDTVAAAVERWLERAGP